MSCKYCGLEDHSVHCGECGSAIRDDMCALCPQGKPRETASSLQKINKSPMTETELINKVRKLADLPDLGKDWAGLSNTSNYYPTAWTDIDLEGAEGSTRDSVAAGGVTYIIEYHWEET